MSSSDRFRTTERTSEVALQAVLVTTPDEETALALARTLVSERLAACANIVSSVRSIYRWDGEVQEDSEVLLVIKTREDRCEALTRRVLALHPYDEPEVLALPIAGGSTGYLEWVATEASP